MRWVITILTAGVAALLYWSAAHHAGAAADRRSVTVRQILQAPAERIETGKPIGPVSALAFDEHGTLVAGSRQSNTIQHLQPGGFSQLVQLQPYADTLTSENPAASCLLPFGPDLLVCDTRSHRIAKVQSNGMVLPLVSRFADKPLNGPLAAALGRANRLYFADAESAIYFTDADNPKWLKVLSRQLKRPAGLATFCKETETLLYAANGDPDHPYWIRFDLSADGSLAKAPQTFADAAALAENWPGQPGPMVVDAAGNLIAAGPGGIHVYDSNGSLLQLLQTADPVTAMAFKPGSKELYFAEGNSIYQIASASAAAPPCPQ